LVTEIYSQPKLIIKKMDTRKKKKGKPERYNRVREARINGALTAEEDFF
jgi:hypothetical protein